MRQRHWKMTAVQVLFICKIKKTRLSEEKYFELGSFIHMNKRDKAHIGLCINNVENVPPIEFNKLNQLMGTFEMLGICLLIKINSISLSLFLVKINHN